MPNTTAVRTAQVGAAPFFAGKNKVINGDFGVWQRGTSFSSASYPTFYADRFYGGTDGSGITRTVSQQTFTPGSAPVAGYEGKYFLRVNQSVAGTGSSYNVLDNRIEDVQTLAGQTATLSFWAKADAARTVTGTFTQYFGVGGSGNVDTSLGSFSVTTSWTRFTATISVPSLSGKTIASGSSVGIRFNLPLNTVQTIDFWGLQLEVGSTATSFQTATGTIQGELAACQRYYYRITITGTNKALATGSAWGTAGNLIQHPFPVVMRVAPTALEQSGTASHYANLNATANLNTCTAVPTFDVGTTTSMGVIGGTATGLAAGNATWLFATSSSGFLGWSAEL
jgi:hypothetical protein